MDNFVYLNGFSLNSKFAFFPDSIRQVYSKKNNLLLSKNYKLYGSDYYGHKLELKDLIETIKTIRNCFQVEYGEWHGIEKVRLKCDAAELMEKCLQDKILNWTFKELKSKFPENLSD